MYDTEHDLRTEEAGQAAVTEQAAADTAAAQGARAETKVSAGGYRFLAVLALLAGAGGLFIGLLGHFTGIFAGAFTGADFLPESLLGFLVSYFKGIFTDAGAFFSALFTGGDVASLLLFALSVLVCVSVVLSLVLAVVSFFSAKSAKNCAMTSAVLVCLSYGGLFLLNYYAVLAAQNAFHPSAADLTTGTIAGIMLIALTVTAFVRRGALAFVNLLHLLLLAAVIFGMAYPGSVTLAADINYTHLGQNILVNLFALITAALIAFNFVACLIRLNAKGAYLFDAVRHCLLLISIVLVAIVQILDKGAEVVFGSDNLLSVIVTMAAALAAFLLSLIATIAMRAKMTAKQAEADSAALGADAAALPAEQASSASAEAVSEQPAPVERIPEEAAKQETPPAAHAAQAAQPAVTQMAQPAQPTVSAPGTTVIIQPAAAPAMPVYAVPFYGAPYAAPAAPAPAPAPAPSAPAEEKRAEAPAARMADNTPMSEFERSMAALARGIAPEQQPARPQPVYRPPLAAQQDACLPSSRTSSAPKAMYDPTPYTYDPFINTLTPQEKNEFGDLFIANRCGDLNYLPAYVIGGDNGEFFRKVFIYLGKFRSHISPALLGKLYDYVSKL